MKYLVGDKPWQTRTFALGSGFGTYVLCVLDALTPIAHQSLRKLRGKKEKQNPESELGKGFQR